MSKKNNSSRGPSFLGFGVTLGLLGSGALIGYGLYRGDRVGVVMATTGATVGTVVTTVTLITIVAMGAMAIGLLWFGLAIWNR